MGYNDDGIVKVDQELFQPADRIQVKMVGGLVEQKDIRIAEQGSCKQDFDLHVAGQILHDCLVEFRRDPESVQEGFRI